MRSKVPGSIDKIKEYVSNLPVLIPLQSGIPLILYLTTTATTIGAIVVQKIEREESVIYYISKKFHEYETQYTALEKIVLALVWATKKLRLYMLTYTVHVIALMDPIRDFLQQSLISGKVARWTIRLLKFDLYYIPMKSIKGRAVSNVLIDLPTEDQREESFDSPHEEVFQVKQDMWIMYFHGSLDQKGF